ncbi:MAG: hypothetical protein PHI37_02980 [Candidatus Gracilibacteria bacterium]|nr:hypothetical protein [Candidatus Gracilibacteria bacterium]
MRNKDIFSMIIILLFIIITFYLNSIIGVLSFLTSIGIYTIIFYSFHIIWRSLLKKEIIDSMTYIKNFIFRVSIFLIIIVSFFSITSYLLNEVYKAKMPEYTISNGEKIVKFQAMVHIGSQNFYDNIENNIREFKKNGGVLFFEGVKPGTEENMEKFNQAMGINFDEDLYKNFSKLYGVTFQDNNQFLGLENELDFNIDLSVDDIIKLYKEKNIENNKQKNYGVPIDANKEILDTLSNLNEKELKILVYLNQAILNMIIGSESTQGFLSDNFTNKELFEVILDERNKILVNEIQKSEYKKIYITYGLLHFKGVLKELQKLDPKWEIIEIKYLYPIN